MNYWQEKQTRIKHLQSSSEILETESGYVEVAQLGKGPSVLISHGGGGGYDMGTWLSRLIGEGYYYIAPSRFGYLRSPLPENPTPERQADRFAHLLDALSINSVFILGLSSGGPSALQFAQRHLDRCKGLVLLSAISHSLPPLPLALRMLYPVVLRSDFIPWMIYKNQPGFVHRSNGINPGILKEIKEDPEKINLLDELFLTIFPASMRRLGMINDQQQCAHLPDDILSNIQVPTQVIHAIDDPIVPFEFGELSAQHISDAEFEIVSGGGHFCAVTHREVIIPKIRDFFGKHKII
jgi:pimeloyl-ACP methyl ester carboxylesterase